MEIKQRQSKEARQIRYFHYLTWAVALRKNECGPLTDDSAPCYTFPAIVLEFIRTLVPGDIKGEIWEDAYEVKLNEFCSALCLPKL